MYIYYLVSLVSAGCIKQSSTVEHGLNTNQTVNQNTVTNTKTYKASGTEGKSALEALKSKYDVKTKTSAGLGEYIESIDGVTPDTNHYWAFYVNGQPSSVAASRYVSKKGDAFEMKLEAIVNE